MVLLIPVTFKLLRSRFSKLGWFVTPVSIFLIRYISLWFNIELGFPFQGELFVFWFGFYYLGVSLKNGYINLQLSPKCLTNLCLFSLVIQGVEGFIWYWMGNFDMATTQLKMSSIITTGLFCISAYIYIEAGDLNLSEQPVVLKKFLKVLGDNSFGIYLCHILIIRILNKLVPMANVFPINTIFVIMISTVCVMMAHRILNGEIIMDYSIHDAIEAGFNKIVFIIRKDIKDAFKEAIGDRIEKICKDLDVEIAYAYQELNELPEGVELPTGRTKPWGTGQAVLACKEVLHEPFAVINADDYYGKEAFVKLHDFLVGYTPEKANQFCMAGFILKNTLSENGAVTRGICKTNEEGYLTAVHETSNIVKIPEGAAVDNDGQLTSINAESYASMNMWGLTSEFMQTLEDGFKEFFANMGNKDILKAEYLLPIYVDELLQAGRVSVKVLDTNDKWFGVTYKEDKDYVVKSFAKLIEAGVYQKNLFEDLK